VEISKAIVLKGESKESKKYQVICVSKEVIAKVRKKYPNINLKQTVDNLLEELAKGESK